jgi:hypothetical protein
VPFWVRPFTMSLPGTAAEILAAATTVDPNEMYGATGLLHPGIGLEIQVVDTDRIQANLWAPGGRGSHRGPILRAAVESDGARTRLVGELSWRALATAFAIMPLLIAAAIYGGFWGAKRRPDEVTFSHYFFWGIAAALTLLITFALSRLPRRMDKDESQLKDALLRDLG